MACTQKKKKTTESAVNKEKKKKRNRTPMNTRLKQGATMNKLFLVLALLLFALSACSVGKKCTYTQDGTKISSWVWFFNGDKPIDLDKNNCN